MARKDPDATKIYNAEYYQEHKDEKKKEKNAKQREYNRKTGANQRYNKEHYTQISVREKKDIAMAYKDKCAKLGISISKPIHDAIIKFLEDE